MEYAVENMTADSAIHLQLMLHTLMQNDSTKEEREKVNSIQAHIRKRTAGNHEQGNKTSFGSENDNKFVFGEGSRMVNIQVNVNQQGDTSQEGSEGKKELNKEQLARAIENCQKYFWANASYAVVYCICRDAYKLKMSKSSFETMIEDLPYTKVRSRTCPAGTIANAFSDNPIYADDISEWDNKAGKRIIKLRDALLKELKL